MLFDRTKNRLPIKRKKKLLVTLFCLQLDEFHKFVDFMLSSHDAGKFWKKVKIVIVADL